MNYIELNTFLPWGRIEYGDNIEKQSIFLKKKRTTFGTDQVLCDKVLAGNYNSLTSILFGIEIEDSGKVFIVEMAAGDVVQLNYNQLLVNEKKDIHDDDIIGLINESDEKIEIKFQRFRESTIEEAFCLGQISIGSNQLCIRNSPYTIINDTLDKNRQSQLSKDEISLENKNHNSKLEVKISNFKDFKFPVVVKDSNSNSTNLDSETQQNPKENVSKSYAKDNHDRENKVFFEQSYTCPICWLLIDDCFKNGPCNHIFCGSCIDSWLLTKPMCPVCKVDVDECKRDQNDNRIIKSFIEMNPEYKKIHNETDKIKSNYIDIKSYNFIREKSNINDNNVNGDSDDEDDGIEKYGLLGLVNFQKILFE